jgi:hypothetical protein
MFLPLTVTLKRSSMLLLIVALLHGLAAWAVTLTALPSALQGSIVFLLVVSMARQGWLYWRFPAGQKIRALGVDRKNALWLEGDGQEAQPAELENAWLGPGLGVASVRSRERMYRVLWLPDSADAQALRRWRVWLRWNNARAP